jgi:hypothetical protein
VTGWSTSGTSVNFNWTTRRHIPETGTLHSHRRVNLKSKRLEIVTCDNMPVSIARGEVRLLLQELVVWRLFQDPEGCYWNVRREMRDYSLYIVTNVSIAGQRFGDHVPDAMNRRGINARCREGRSLMTNLVRGTFPWQQTGNRHFPWLPLDCISSSGEKNEPFVREFSVQLRRVNQPTEVADS